MHIFSRVLPESEKAEKAANEIMAIPIYPELTDEMKDFVAETILAFYSKSFEEYNRRG
jgi:dTDP-4-amino-4,6-dideoxygalactose transaminase